MKTKLAVLLLCCAIGSGLKAQTSSSQEKAAQLADLNVYGDSLDADGMWRADNLNDKTELSFDAATRVECYKHGGKALVSSDAYCKRRLPLSLGCRIFKSNTFQL